MEKAAARHRPRILFLCLLMASLFLPSSAQSCTSFSFSQNRVFARCNSLLRLGASLHWNYHPSNGTVDVAYRAQQSSNGWVAWGINPSGTGMQGTQALVAFQNSSSMTAYTTGVSSLSPSMRPESLSFTATGVQAEYSGGVMTIFATLQLPSNRTRVNHAWQASTTFASGYPAGHPTTGDNVNSVGTLDFLSGVSASAGNSKTGRKNLSL